MAEKINLYNPFRDSIGRFASKVGAGVGSGIAKRKEAVKTQMKQEGKRRAAVVNKRKADSYKNQIGRSAKRGATIFGIAGAVVGGGVSYAITRDAKFSLKQAASFGVKWAAGGAVSGAVAGGFAKKQANKGKYSSNMYSENLEAVMLEEDPINVLYALLDHFVNDTEEKLMEVNADLTSIPGFKKSKKGSYITREDAKKRLADLEK